MTLHLSEAQLQTAAESLKVSKEEYISLRGKESRNPGSCGKVTTKFLERQLNSANLLDEANAIAAFEPYRKILVEYLDKLINSCPTTEGQTILSMLKSTINNLINENPNNSVEGLALIEKIAGYIH